MSAAFNAVEVPFQPQPRILTMTIGGIDYQLQTRFNVFSACWTMDISDDPGNLLIGQIPLVTGANLLGPYAHLAIGGSTGTQLFVYSDQNLTAVPQFADLGVTGHVIFRVPV